MPLPPAKYHLLFVALTGCLCFSCSRPKDIRLDIVRHLPGYCHNKFLFGENEKQMEEKNAFILATGEIDTTSEYPPIEVAYVTIHKQMLQLNLSGRKKTATETVEEYTGNGYTLFLSIAKGELVITNGTLKSVYTVLKHTGYS